MRRWFTVSIDCCPIAELLISLVLPLMLVSALSPDLRAQGPALTTISDTVYRADGTQAAGSVLISWPSFQTAEGDAVAAGDLAVTLGPAGSFTAQLLPNVGASPAGTYYVVVFQLDDGSVRTEYWAVPATSPTNIAGVLTTPGTGLGNSIVTQQYVNAAVAALNATTVHLSGAETITGVKQFDVPPSLPTPVGASDATNKSYVDTAVSNVGSGAYVAIAGGTMTGPLTLPADPTAPNQASDRHYVDNGLLAKADLVSGTVPSGELGTGVANSSTCLNGNATWGACGGGAPAGITYATTALNWTQTISSSLIAGTQATVTLTPCPVGVDTTSGAGYQVLLSGGGNSETVNVVTVAGGCTSAAPSGTIKFTPFFPYPAGYTVSSASSGIQETLNAACGVSATAWQNSQCNVTIPANGPNSTVNIYNVFGTIYLHSNQSLLSGYGTTLNCVGRGACLQVGDLKSSNDSTDNTVVGLKFRSPTSQAANPSFAGVPITQTQRTSQVVTITTAMPHGFRVGDMVTNLFTDSPAYWGDAVVTAVPGPTTFQYAHAGGDIATQATPGVVALAYVAVLDNALNTHFTDISYDKVGEGGHFNNFFDLWDDENTTIDHFNNQAIQLNANVNWTGSFVFSAGNQAIQTAPVITLRDSTITANDSNGVTVYNSNGVYVENTVLQATGPWQVYSANTTGNYQGAYLKNIYSESSVNANPPLSVTGSVTGGACVAGEQMLQSSTSAASYLENAVTGSATMVVGGLSGTADGTHTWTGQTSACVYTPTSVPTGRSPFPGTGIAGLIAGATSAAGSFSVLGSGGVGGAFPSGGAGSNHYTYFIVANDTTQGWHTAPMQVLNWSSTGNDKIPVLWPRVANGADVINYDVIRIATPGIYPYSGGCTGGSGGTCGSVATGLSQATACAGALVCEYTDSGSASTNSYNINGTFFAGPLNFWPGGIVDVNLTVSTDVDLGNLVNIALPSGTPIQIAKQCPNYGQTAPLTYTVCPLSGHITDAIVNPAAFILPDGGNSAPAAGSVGKLIIGGSQFGRVAAHHIITLIDGFPGGTQATPGYRRAWSANDMFIGTDTPGTVYPYSGSLGLSFGAPWAITNYIGQVGDGVHANWLERLTASLKEFNVPAKFDQSVTLAGLPNGCLNITSGVIASTGSSCGSGGGGGSVASVFGRSGAVVAATGDYTVSQVTGAAVDAAVVHNTGNETINGTKTFAGNLLLPAGFAFLPAVGGIGIDTAAGLPVVNINGTNEQIALTSSNISGQAGTALALASTPTQCSSSFATGIAANGNANCSTPDVIQLQETTPPAGIPGWGVFWFDSSAHAPKFIDNNGTASQLGFTNLFNSDPGGDLADNLEEINPPTAPNPPNFRVYSTFSNTAWQRTSLGFDSSDNYAVLRSENSTSASAAGLGLWIGSSLKWVVDATGNLKPWVVSGSQDNQFSIGSDTGNAMKSVFAKTSFNIYNQGRQDFEFANDPTIGTTLNNLAVYNSGATGVQTAATSNTDGVVGLVSGGAGTGAGTKAVLTWAGYAACNFDAASPVAGDFVVASTTQAGKCHDTGSTTRPSGVQVIGRIEAGGLRVSLDPPSGGGGGGGGSVSSVFGRTGSVTASTGDYSVSQVTGAAVDSTVVHLAGTETITGSKTFSSDVTLSGNLNVAGNINQTSTGPTQWSGQLWTGTTVTVPSGMNFSLGVGSDNIFKCQLTSGASCLPSAQVASAFGRTGVVVAASGDYSVAQITGAAPLASPVFTGTPAVPGYVPTSTTVNGHALTANVTVSASDLTTGTVPSAQLPTPACSWITVPTQSGTGNVFSGTNKAIVWGVYNPYPCITGNVAYVVGTADNTTNNYALGLYTGSSGGTGTLVATTASMAGTTFAPSAGIKHISWNASGVTVPAGRVYIALTSNCASSCAALLGTPGTGVTWAANLQVSVTAGGAALPSSLTLPTDSLSSGASIPSLIVY